MPCYNTAMKKPRPFERPGQAGGPVLTLIYPDIQGRVGASDALQPLALAALAAHTPAHWNIRVFDERLERVDTSESSDLVAISVLTFSARRAYALAADYRRRGVSVVMGGFHPTLLPEESAEFCDVVVTGDCEEIWPRVLEDFLAGGLERRYEGGVCSDPSLIRFDRSIFAGKKYSPLVPVQAARGCRYSCDFCSIHSFYGQHLISRPASQVIDEIRQIPGRLILFTDDNLLAGGAELAPLLTGLKSLKKKWSCQISIDAVADLPLLKEMARAGCLSVFVGFESLDVASLKVMGKTGNLGHQDYEKAIKAFRQVGIMVSGAFVFGYPGDKAETVHAALKFGVKNKLTLCHFNTLFPFPKTRVYDRLEAQGRLLYSRWWLDPNFRYGDMMFLPETMDPDELAQTCYAARQEFNSWANIVRRGGDIKSNARSLWNLGAFLAANLVSRREIRRKHGRHLGEPDPSGGRQ